MSSSPPQTLKLLLIGSSSVGKSSLLLRFTDEMFVTDDEAGATIGVDFKNKIINRHGKRFKLSIWDTAGQERFRTLTSSYYRGAQGIMLVYDVTSRETFESLSSWFRELDTFITNPDVVRIVVGNKVDKESARTVTREEGEAFAAAREPPAFFMEASAKGGLGVDELFEEVVDRILDRPSLWSTSPSLARKGPSGVTQPPGSYPADARINVASGEGWSGSGCSC